MADSGSRDLAYCIGFSQNFCELLVGFGQWEGFLIWESRCSEGICLWSLLSQHAPVGSVPACPGAYQLRALGQKGDLELFIPLDPPYRWPSIIWGLLMLSSKLNSVACCLSSQWRFSASVGAHRAGLITRCCSSWSWGVSASLPFIICPPMELGVL